MPINLSLDDIQTIRSELATSTDTELGSKYKIHPSQVWRIRHGKAWKNLPYRDEELVATNKDLKEVERKARRQGWDVSRVKNGHMNWISPVDGATITSSTSPSDINAVRALVRDLVDHGYQENPTKQRKAPIQTEGTTMTRANPTALDTAVRGYLQDHPNEAIYTEAIVAATGYSQKQINNKLYLMMKDGSAPELTRTTRFSVLWTPKKDEPPTASGHGTVTVHNVPPRVGAGRRWSGPLMRWIDTDDKEDLAEEETVIQRRLEERKPKNDPEAPTPEEAEANAPQPVDEDDDELNSWSSFKDDDEELTEKDLEDFAALAEDDKPEPLPLPADADPPAWEKAYDEVPPTAVYSNGISPIPANAANTSLPYTGSAPVTTLPNVEVRVLPEHLVTTQSPLVVVPTALPTDMATIFEAVTMDHQGRIIARDPNGRLYVMVELVPK